MLIVTLDALSVIKEIHTKLLVCYSIEKTKVVKAQYMTDGCN
jgi:hypothetical protein